MSFYYLDHHPCLLNFLNSMALLVVVLPSRLIVLQSFHHFYSWHCFVKLVLTELSYGVSDFQPHRFLRQFIHPNLKMTSQHLKMTSRHLSLLQDFQELSWRVLHDRQHNLRVHDQPLWSIVFLPILWTGIFSPILLPLPLPFHICWRGSATDTL